MNFIKWKINLILISISVLGLFVVFFTDDYDLNSLIKKDTNNSLVINEINTNNGYKLNFNIDDKGNIKDNEESNEWAFPVEGNYVVTTYYNVSHKAVDLYSYKGYNSNIMAANDGEVVETGGGCNNQGSYCNGRRGNYIVIKHYVKDYYTIYMHLNKIYVEVGDNVKKKDVIASMGNTGYVIPARTDSNPYNGTHLHFCLYIGRPYRGGYAVDPLQLY